MSKFNNQFATQKLRQEMSVTGTGATFTPGTGEQTAPRVTKKVVKKKLNPEVKDVEPKLAAGKAKVYMKDKWGWKDAPSIPNRPSKGGFIYKQLFEGQLEERSINENLEPGDRVKVVYGNEFYGETGTIDDVVRGFVTVEMDSDGRIYSMHSSDVEKIEDEDDDDMLQEANVPDNVMKFAQRKGVSSLVNTVAGWAEKIGKKIVDGTAIGKNYDTLILDMGYQTSDIYINIPEETVELYGQEVNSFEEFKEVYMDQMTKDQMSHDEDEYRRETGLEEIESLNESYSKFKTETKTRGKADQFHQAVRQVRQKVQEINRLFEYVSRLKSELSEAEGGLKYKVHTEKALAKIKEMVAELNQNIKKFK